MKRGLYLAPFDELADPRAAPGAAPTDSRLGRGKLANRRPVQRAVRWDGLFPIELPGPEGLAEEVRRARAGSDAPFDLVVEVPSGADVHAWEADGATWVLTSIDPQSPEPEVRAVVDAGP